jgi:hypothetical protein
MHDDVADLVRLAGTLKNAAIAVDVISFGEVLENVPKLEAFVSAVDTEGNRYEEGRQTLHTMKRRVSCSTDSIVQNS